MSGKKDLIEELRAEAARKKTKQIAIRLPESLDAEVRKLAKETGADYAAVVRKLLEMGLEVIRGK